MGVYSKEYMRRFKRWCPFWARIMVQNLQSRIENRRITRWRSKIPEGMMLVSRKRVRRVCSHLFGFGIEMTDAKLYECDLIDEDETMMDLLIDFAGADDIIDQAKTPWDALTAWASEIRNLTHRVPKAIYVPSHTWDKIQAAKEEGILHLRIKMRQIGRIGYDYVPVLLDDNGPMRIVL